MGLLQISQWSRWFCWARAKVGKQLSDSLLLLLLLLYIDGTRWRSRWGEEKEVNDINKRYHMRSAGCCFFFRAVVFFSCCCRWSADNLFISEGHPSLLADPSCCCGWIVNYSSLLARATMRWGGIHNAKRSSVSSPRFSSTIFGGCFLKTQRWWRWRWWRQPTGKHGRSTEKKSVSEGRECGIEWDARFAENIFNELSGQPLSSPLAIQGFLANFGNHLCDRLYISSCPNPKYSSVRLDQS